ncbi:hypothetical protein HBH98_023160 [Parastagonospora nodorum]|nr:hypothetical protein HBH53_075680 [Parastagonospora nodorum]KAH4041997.1 hypothetical protein HBI09_007310 [Parastagonospora nodorum]KAH4073481.1 hypothetical protein HBH50_054660 [Parastagonospora nodorum]KAH4099455.1 hypothetical protein HBH48_007460 [Parastagonospora nodorum]KAH4111373.1 hypothetical protein HBH46_007030 [Parastagonospora nodorum]
MPGRYRLAAFHALTSFALAIATDPADPTITPPAILPRQGNDAQFIGYIESSGTWFSESCNAGLTWYQTGQYAQCCAASRTACYAATACVSGSLIFPISDRSTRVTLACTENYVDQSASICNTAFIFENFGDSNPKTDIICGPSSANYSYYRRVPASVTQGSSQAPLSIPQPKPSGFDSLSTSGDSDSGGGSKAWIAGAVIGPIVGLALLGLLLFCCLRRKKKNKLKASQEGTATMAPIHPQPPAGVAGHTDAKPQPMQQNHYATNAYLNAATAATQGTYSSAPSPPPTQNYVGMPPPNTGAPYNAANAPYNAGTAPYNGGVAPYNAATAPYNAPVSPPPQQTHYGLDGQSSGGGKTQGTAELGGGAATASGTAPSELPSGKTTWLDAITS